MVLAMSMYGFGSGLFSHCFLGLSFSFLGISLNCPKLGIERGIVETVDRYLNDAQNGPSRRLLGF